MSELPGYIVLLAALLRASPLACQESSGAVEEVPAGPPLRDFTEWFYDGPDSSTARVKAAEEAKLEVVRGLFESAGVAFPPHSLLFRIFKQEQVVEVWAGDRNKPMRQVTRYGICSASGGLGPKRRSGDMQVPEGYYHVDLFNPHSSFYLSLRVGYPNASDRILGKRGSLGGDIMIHGNCVSIGCIALSDERMQEVWVMADAVRKAKRKVHVHIFPARDLAGLIAQTVDEERRSFWENLLVGKELFDQEGRLPSWSVGADGRYRFGGASTGGSEGKQR